MTDRVFIFVSRMLFIVMALTFLSPALGAQIVADHDQLHAQTTYSDDSLPTHAHDTDDDHDTAHALIGHLFLHMPVFSSVAFEVAISKFTGAGDMPVPQFSLPFSIPELPFKPPRVLLFA